MKSYSIGKCEDSEEFLKKMCIRFGRLLKMGEPDTKSMAVKIINDF